MRARGAALSVAPAVEGGSASGCDAGPGPVSEPVPGDAPATGGIRAALMAGDAIAVFVGFAVPLLAWAEVRPASFWYGLFCAAVVTVIGTYAMRFQGLWLDRVNAVRAIEISRIAKALAVASVIALVLDRKSDVVLRAPRVALAALVGWLVIVMWRAAYHAFVAAQRRQGRLLRRVILIGTDRRAEELHRVLDVHKDLGMRVVAVFGDRAEAEAAEMGHLWRADYLDAGASIGAIEAEAVILCSSDVDPLLAAELTRGELSRQRAIYVDPGLSAFDIRRFQATHLAHQPLLQIESRSLPTLQRLAKRVFDIVVAGLVAALAAPVMAAIALAIKIEDRGPVLFKQRRVGRDGAEFPIYKFRTMVVDAEARLADLAEANGRSGPLFKMDRDPRVTRVGRFLRATSLDELPQLFNVLRGSMSLVGPRPALPAEVEAFDDELKTRHRVTPGITGLWQVTARDNPSFDAYRRLDLFYVENWSLALDFVILLGTVDHIVIRPLVKWLCKSGGELDAPAADATEGDSARGLSVVGSGMAVPTGASMIPGAA